MYLPNQATRMSLLNIKGVFRVLTLSKLLVNSKRQVRL